MRRRAVAGLPAGALAKAGGWLSVVGVMAGAALALAAAGLLITTDGYENMSGFVPSDIDGIERLMREEPKYVRRR